MSTNILKNVKSGAKKLALPLATAAIFSTMTSCNDNSTNQLETNYKDAEKTIQYGNNMKATKIYDIVTDYLNKNQLREDILQGKVIILKQTDEYELRLSRDIGGGPNFTIEKFDLTNKSILDYTYRFSVGEAYDGKRKIYIDNEFDKSLFLDRVLSDLTGSSLTTVKWEDLDRDPFDPYNLDLEDKGDAGMW